MRVCTSAYVLATEALSLSSEIDAEGSMGSMNLPCAVKVQPKVSPVIRHMSIISLGSCSMG